MQDSSLIKSKFYHLVLRGSPYEIGRAQGEGIHYIKPAVDFFGSGPLPENPVPAGRTIKLMEKHCPGLIEEMTGFCEGAGISLDRLVYLSMTHLGGLHCSHFAVLPTATSKGHMLVGRNYDFGHQVDDLRLTTIFPAGGLAHTGFPTLFFGRNDGLNESGLSVTMSAGGIPVGLVPGQRPPVQEGLQFWALVRTLLDTCKTTVEAEDRFDSFPCCGNPILIIADAAGNVSLAEAYGPHKKITRLDPDSKFMGATNHYQSLEMNDFSPAHLVNSTVRLEAIQRFCTENSGKVTSENIKSFLSTKYPEGLCTHHYSDFFGTLHSCVFDLTARTAEVAFGSPAANPWHRVDFTDPHPGEFEVVLPDQTADRDFWAMTE